MSWDVLLLNYGGAPPDPEGPSEPLGSGAEVRDRLSALLPEVNWAHPAWGLYRAGAGCSIEFNLGRTEPVESIMLHVRGDGAAAGAVAALAAQLGWAALDMSSTEFLAPAAASGAGWEAFLAYRDRVVRENPG